MASTLTLGEGVNLVGLKFPRLLTEGFSARVANEVLEEMWMRYPWKPSLAELPPFYLVLEESDYIPPFSYFPVDFFGLHDAWVREWTGWRSASMTVVPTLEPSQSPGLPSSIAYQPEIGGWRIHPRPSMSAPEWWIEGIYKKSITKVTQETLQSYAFPWDDRYFAVFRKGLVWKVKDLIASPQEAMAERAEFYSMLDMMAVSEGLHSGVTIIHPAEGLSYGG
jgi:hypothetical protein